MNKLSPRWFLSLYALLLCCLAPLRPLWLDEVLQLSDAYHNKLHETIDRVAHNPGGVPLPYMVENVFVNLVGHPFYAARLLSILWAVSGMAGFIWLVRLLDTSATWPSVALTYALMPISLRYALEIRQYGPALAFGICATALLLWLNQKPNWKRAVLYAFVLTLGLYSHPYIAFLALAHMVWTFRQSSASYALPACAVSVLLFLPWYLYARGFWVQAVAKGGYQSSFSWKTPLMILHELSGGGYFLTGALLVLAGYGFRHTTIRAKNLLLFCILVPLPIVLGANALFHYFFAIRQLVFVVPFLCVLTTEGLDALPKTVRRTLAAALVTLAVIYDVRWFD